MSGGLVNAVVVYEGAPAPLARLERAVQALAEARTLDEVTHIKALAEAAAAYARAEKLGADAIRYANAIRIRAAAKAGDLLARMEKAKGGATPGVGRRGAGNAIPIGQRIPRLVDLGITAKQSARYQAIAAVQRESPGLFEDLLRGESVTESKVAAALVPVKPLEPEAQRRREDFGRLCGELVALGRPREVAMEMASDKAVVGGALKAAAWLRLFYAATIPPDTGDGLTLIAEGCSQRRRAASLGEVLSRFGRLQVQAESDPISAWLVALACVLDVRFGPGLLPD